MIKAINITKKYSGNIVLKDLMLNCDSGKIQLLIGGNGSGKTTLINILAKLLIPDSGEVSYTSNSIKYTKQDFKRETGFVFEKNVEIEKFTAEEYLTFVSKLHQIPKVDYRKRVSALISFFELSSIGKKYIEAYSKGMRKKIKIAAAIIHRPIFLILDEPFDGIDLPSAYKILETLREMSYNGTTILIASHQFNLVSEYCDNIALLKNGQIEFNQPIEEFKMNAKNSYEGITDPIPHHLKKLLERESDEDLTWIKSN